MIDQRTAPYAALLLRLSLGSMFLAHGLLKVMVFTPAGTAGFFNSLGLPSWLAYATIVAEILGGLLLIAGIRTRLVALALLPILIGAVWVHSGNGWLFSNENGGWEFPLFLAIAAVAQTLLGDGAYSLGKLFGSHQAGYSEQARVA
jgi:putative oxidoreductase